MHFEFVESFIRLLMRIVGVSCERNSASIDRLGIIMRGIGVNYAMLHIFVLRYPRFLFFRFMNFV